jgi:hypothetical protein
LMHKRIFFKNLPKTRLCVESVPSLRWRGVRSRPEGRVELAAVTRRSTPKRPKGGR